MEKHEDFTRWAVERGVKINGIKPYKFEGRGLGIIAEKRLGVCETLLCCVLFIVLLHIHHPPNDLSKSSRFTQHRTPSFAFSSDIRLLVQVLALLLSSISCHKEYTIYTTENTQGLNIFEANHLSS